MTPIKANTPAMTQKNTRAWGVWGMWLAIDSGLAVLVLTGVLLVLRAAGQVVMPPPLHRVQIELLVGSAFLLILDARLRVPVSRVGVRVLEHGGSLRATRRGKATRLLQVPAIAFVVAFMVPVSLGTMPVESLRERRALLVVQAFDDLLASDRAEHVFIKELDPTNGIATPVRLYKGPTDGQTTARVGRPVGGGWYMLDLSSLAPGRYHVCCGALAPLAIDLLTYDTDVVWSPSEEASRAVDLVPERGIISGAGVSPERVFYVPAKLSEYMPDRRNISTGLGRLPGVRLGGDLVIMEAEPVVWRGGAKPAGRGAHFLQATIFERFQVLREQLGPRITPRAYAVQLRAGKGADADNVIGVMTWMWKIEEHRPVRKPGLDEMCLIALCGVCIVWLVFSMYTNVVQTA